MTELSSVVRCARILDVLVRYLVWLIRGYNGFVLVCPVWSLLLYIPGYGQSEYDELLRPASATDIPCS